MLEQSGKYRSDIKERAYTYAIKIIKLIDKINGSESGRVMGKQILRSATSIGANIIEASQRK